MPFPLYIPGPTQAGRVLVSGAVTSGMIGNQAVASGQIASGSIGSVHIQDGTIVTADIASGQVQSGQIGSGTVVNNSIASGAVQGLAGGGIFSISSGTLNGFELGSGAVVSGRIASGVVGNFHVASGQIQGLAGAGVPNIASGTINFANLGSGAVRSGHVANRAVTSGCIDTNSVHGFFGPLSQVSSGSLGVYDFGSGAVITGAVGSGAIQSGNIASGVVGTFHVASGQLNSMNFGSGAQVRTALVVGGTPMTSGTTTFIPILVQITNEVVSGAVAVYSDSSGAIGVAKAATSGKWPAVGVALKNALSGTTVEWAQVGAIQFTSGLSDYSGYVGRRVWLGRSGQITTISGSWSSGGFASGDVGQPIGVIANSGAVWFNVFPVIWSGGPLGVAAGGTF